MADVRKQLRSWDPSRQQRYRAHTRITIHLLRDASSSMGDCQVALRAACLRYFDFLALEAPPETLLDVRDFSSQLSHSVPVSVTAIPPWSYRPDGGTALYDAVGQVLGEIAGKPGQHILLVTSDGEDSGTENGGSQDWQPAQIKRRIQAMPDCLCLFLGAFPEALTVALEMGFPESNCLVFETTRFPEAFEQVIRANRRYFLAPAPERKLLAAGGAFAETGAITCQP